MNLGLVGLRDLLAVAATAYTITYMPTAYGLDVGHVTLCQQYSCQGICPHSQ